MFLAGVITVRGLLMDPDWLPGPSLTRPQTSVIFRCRRRIISSAGLNSELLRRGTFEP